jgi:hypothetical protein
MLTQAMAQVTPGAAASAVTAAAAAAANAAATAAVKVPSVWLP